MARLNGTLREEQNKNIYKKLIELRNEDEKMNENKEHYEVINDDKDVRAPLTSSPNNAAKSSSSLSSSTR